MLRGTKSSLRRKTAENPSASLSRIIHLPLAQQSSPLNMQCKSSEVTQPDVLFTGALPQVKTNVSVMDFYQGANITFKWGLTL